MWGGDSAASRAKEKEMMWGYDGFGFAGGGMGIGMLLFWALIIGALVVLLRGIGGGKSGGGEPGVRGKTPLDILGERYARGEIDKTEFEQKRRDLSAA
jgi:putative membrane protein